MLMVNKQTPNCGLATSRPYPHTISPFHCHVTAVTCRRLGLVDHVETRTTKCGTGLSERSAVVQCQQIIDNQGLPAVLTRSKPPPWMSMIGPMRDRIMALHSMCHPGRPWPQGDSQVGSPGLAAFQRAKSDGLRLRLSNATLSPALLSSCSSSKSPLVHSTAHSQVACMSLVLSATKHCGGLRLHLSKVICFTASACN